MHPCRFVLALAFLALAPCALAQTPRPIFANAQYFVGDGPQEIESADFDGDGRIDLVTANRFSGDVSVLLANGSSGFHEAQHFAAGAGPQGLAVGDLDHDGRPDVVVACHDSASLAVLLGTGGGSLGVPAYFPAGSGPYDVELADLDLDGHLDFVTADSDGGTVSVGYGDGLGGFASVTQYPAGVAPRSVDMGDLNGDGLPDIAVTQYLNSNVSILLGSSSTGFGTASTFWAGGENPRGLKIAELTSDGLLDIAVMTAQVGLNGRLTILRGNGQGGLAAPFYYYVGVNGGSLAIDDLNRDGRNDLVATSVSPPEMYFFYGNQNGTYGLGQVAVIAGQCESTVIADLNQDGMLDVATAARWTDNVTVLLRGPAGGFLQNMRYAAGDDAGNPALGDLNGDGLLDVATNHWTTGNVTVRFGDGAGGFGSGAPATYPVGPTPTYTAFCDVDLDGDLDIVVSLALTNEIAILRNTGSGTFASAVRYEVGGLFPAFVATADVNQDGWPDVVTPNANSNNVSILLGTAQGGFAPPIRFPTGARPFSVAIGDLNGDGLPDLVTADSTDATITALYGDGQAGFALRQTFPTALLPARVVLGDLNQDSRADVVVICGIANGADTPIYVWLQDDQGVLQPAGSYVTGVNGNWVAIGDLDGDGRQDVAVTNIQSNNVTAFLGDGQGGFASRTSYVNGATTNSCGSDPIALALGDLDQDGKLDIVTTACSDPSLTVLLNRLVTAPGLAMCFADALSDACPCANPGSLGRGCENSSGTGGARLQSGGAASLAADTLQLWSYGELASTLTIFVQGSSFAPHVAFGDGLRCAGGALKRIAVVEASLGVALTPALGETSISQRSQQLGEPLAPGSLRIYQAYYRDPDLSFCPSPQGGSFNASSGQQVLWGM